MSKSIGSYQVVRRLPGDGEAYLTKSHDGEHRVVRLFEAAADASVWNEVQAHVRICATLQHVSVSAVVEVFLDGGKIAIVNAPPPDGLTLAEVIAVGTKLDPTVAWYLGAQIAAALGAAQAAGDDDDDFVTICHGHLAPRHVNISWRGDVSVDGFGLAPVAGGAGVQCDPGYGPPESKATPRGDMYSLAAIVWAALAGKTPTGALSFDALGVHVPAALAEPLSRATESSLGKRKVTSMELEHAFGELGADGKRMLANAMIAVRKAASHGDRKPLSRGKGAALGGALSSKRPLSGRGGLLAGKLAGKGAKSAGPTSPGPTSPGPTSPSGASSQRRMPVAGSSPRSVKRNTIIGQGIPNKVREHLAAKQAQNEPPPARSPTASSPPIDWERQSQSVASKTLALDVDDDLSWGDEDEEAPTMITQRPDLEMLEAIARAEAGDVATEVAMRPAALLDELDDDELDDPDSDDGEMTQVAMRPVIPQTARTEAETTQISNQRALAKAVSATVPMDEVDIEPQSLSALSPPSRLDPGIEVEKDDDSDGAPRPLAGLLDDALGELPDGDDPDTNIDVDTPSREQPEGVADLIDSVLGDVSPSAALEKRDGDGASAIDDEMAGVAEVPPVKRPPPSSSAHAAAGPVSMFTAILITIATAVVVMAAGIGWVRHSSKVGPLPAHTADPSASSQPSASTTISPSIAVSPTALTSSSAAASSSAQADGEDGSALTPKQGYLIVNFAGDKTAEVFLFGKSYGKVDKKVVVPCDRPAFVRVGTPTRKWLTDGEPVQIRCQSVTEVTMTPTD